MRTLTATLTFFALFFSFLSTTGCAKLMGNLRRDLRDIDEMESYEPPVVGGRYSEQGFLAEDYPEGGDGNRYRVGHSDRGPASAGYGSPSQEGSWVTDQHADANRRDMYRTQGASGEEEQPVVSSGNVADLPPPVKRRYKNGSRATRSDFVDETANEGSLWGSDGQTNYYFTKNKIRGPGDIVTVTIEDDLVRDLGLEVRRGLTPQEKEIEYGLARDKIRAKAMGIQTDTVASNSSAPQRGPAAAKTQQPQPAAGSAEAAKKEIDESELPTPKLADLDVAASLQVKTGETMMGEIVERFSNGNYKIRATKKIPYKNGAPRLVTLVGVARGQDITEEDVVNSGKLYEYRIEAIR